MIASIVGLRLPKTLRSLPHSLLAFRASVAVKVHLTSGRTTRLASNLSRYSETNRRVEHLRCAGPSVRGVQYSVHSHGNKGVLRRLLLCGGVSRRGFCSCRPAPVLDRSQILLIQRNRAFGRDGERRGGTHVLRWVRRLGRRASPDHDCGDNGGQGDDESAHTGRVSVPAGVNGGSQVLGGDRPKIAGCE